MLQRTEVVDDASWVMGFMDIIDPAIDSIKRLLKLDQNSFKPLNLSRGLPQDNENVPVEEALETSDSFSVKENNASGFDLDTFVREKLSLEPTDLNIKMPATYDRSQEGKRSFRRVWRPEKRAVTETS